MKQARKRKEKPACHFCGKALTGPFFVGVGADGSEIRVCPECRRKYRVVVTGVVEAGDDE